MKGIGHVRGRVWGSDKLEQSPFIGGVGHGGQSFPTRCRWLQAQRDRETIAVGLVWGARVH